jgi:hypothetical protein
LYIPSSAALLNWLEKFILFKTFCNKKFDKFHFCLLAFTSTTIKKYKRNREKEAVDDR